MAERTLVCAVNWLGDGVMSLPAIQAFRLRFPGRHLAVLAKRRVEAFWRLHPAVDEVLAFDGSAAGTLRAARDVRRGGFRDAWVLPNSFRSALIPFLAGVPVRAGAAGHARRPLLNRVVNVSAAAGRHQAWEYAAILGVADLETLDPPRLRIPQEAAAGARRLLGSRPERPRVGLIPGAARGPSKRWPAPHFADLGRRLGAAGYEVLVLGAPPEAGLCAEVAAGVGAPAVNLAGRTSLAELAAVLALCHVAIANDSGGMHLAAAVGTPVVGIFGLTDPAKTGPLGPGHRVVSPPGARGRRDIARRSSRAAACLRGLSPDAVFGAAMEILNAEPPAHG